MASLIGTASRLGLAALVVAVTLDPAAAQRGAVDLRHDWTAGDVARYRLTEEMVQQISSTGDEEMRWEREIDYTERVVAVDASGATTIERTIDAVRIDARAGRLGRAIWDSHTGKGDRDSRLVAPHASLVGRTIRFTVTDDGRVTDVSGAEGLWVGALTPVLEELFDGGVKTAMPSPVRAGPGPASTGDEPFARQIEQGLRAIPGRAVRPRERWAHSIEHQTPIGVVTSELTHTFQGVRRTRRGHVARITVSGELSGGPADVPAAQQLEQLTGLAIRLTRSQVTGETLFDYEAGRVVRAEMIVRLAWSIEVGDVLTNRAAGRELAQTMDQRAVLELLD